MQARGPQGQCLPRCCNMQVPALHASTCATGRWASTADACCDVHHIVLISSSVPAWSVQSNDHATLSPAGGAADGGALDFLRTNPQFQLLRRAVASNPNILIPMLQELGKSNPQLLQVRLGDAA